MSSTSSTHPTITVEPLHPTQQQANLPNPSLPNPMLGAKAFLMKKMAGGYVVLSFARRGGRELTRAVGR